VVFETLSGKGIEAPNGEDPCRHEHAVTAANLVNDK